MGYVWTMRSPTRLAARRRARGWERQRLALLRSWAARHDELQAASDDASQRDDGLCRSARLEDLAVRLWTALYGLGARYVIDHWVDRRSGARFSWGRPRPGRRARGLSL